MKELSVEIETVANPLPVILAECTVPSCKEKAEGEASILTLAGWRGFAESTEHRTHNRWRTHLGWCPKCAVKFGVE